MPLRDWALALLANTAWAFNFVAGKEGSAQFEPLMFTALRFSVVLLLLFPFLKIIPGQMNTIIKIGALLGVGHFSLIFLGINMAGGVGGVAIATQLYVPFATLMAWLWLGEFMTVQRWLGTFLAFAGVVLVGFDPEVLKYWQALLLVSIAGLFMAVATIWMKRLQGVGIWQLQAWIAAVATPCLWTLSLLFEHHQLQLLTSAHWWQWAAPVYSALGATLTGHAIVYYLVQRYPVSLTTPLLMISPIMAIFIGILIYGEEPGWKLWVGAAMTLSGIGVIHARLRGRRRPPRPL
ncbi:DMT family transporter [Pokkaliibacter sp. MBI-7]|uniref:DMT family transporter n=1 Tax=Pokkaliibacter sp. MBI-7 TaxID=3040600 RepID=UPI00244C3B16|nr:DMT family transporter [Pokkaliibacter sp. MBI-7]MDH2433174.1 DMT family transporter [Pokkaliibacter sp. MBI-7]